MVQVSSWHLSFGIEEETGGLWIIMADSLYVCVCSLIFDLCGQEEVLPSLTCPGHSVVASGKGTGCLRRLSWQSNLGFVPMA